MLFKKANAPVVNHAFSLVEILLSLFLGCIIYGVYLLFIVIAIEIKSNNGNY